MTTIGASRVRRHNARPVEQVILLAGCLSLVMSLLVVTVAAAARLGGLAGIGGIFGSGPLDYARGPLGEYFPLTDAFVQDALGPSFVEVSGATPPVTPVAAATGTTTSGRDNGRDHDDVVPPQHDLRGELGNDDFENAYLIRGLPFSARSTAPATRESGEPLCGPTGGTRWFRYTPRSDIGLLATTAGTELGASIAVYTGESMDDLFEIGCAGGPNGGGHVPFAAEAGTTYWFQAAKTVGDGVLVFSLHVQGRTTLASVSSDGRPAGADSSDPHTSADGRFVAFVSLADLVPGTQNGCVSSHHPNPGHGFVRVPGACQNVYLRDLLLGRTTLVSTGDGEVAGDDDSWSPLVSSDGRFVAFTSWASNLVAGDTNGRIDVFLRDVVAQRTVRVNVTSAGAQTSDAGHYSEMAVSDDGRFVAFSSNAPELTLPAAGDFCEPPTCVAAFIRDVHMGRTHLVSVDSDGDAYGGESMIAGMSADGSRVAFNIGHGSLGPLVQVMVSDWQQPGRVFIGSAPDAGRDEFANEESRCLYRQCLSADGRRLVFVSLASNLVDGDTNDDYDVFVRDLAESRTTMVSVSSAGAQGHPQPTLPLHNTNASAGYPSAAIAADGRFVVFSTDAPDLVLGDTNGTYDVFVHDLLRRTTTRVSVREDGTESPGISYYGSPSRDARTIGFIGRGFDGEDTSTSAVYARQVPAY